MVQNMTKKTKQKELNKKNEKKVNRIDYSREPQKTRTKPKLKQGKSDKFLLALILILLAFGLVMVLSASAPTSLSDYGNSYELFRKQVMFAAVGCVGMLLLSMFDYKWYARYYRAFYVLGVAVLTLTMTPLGETINGATRWIYIGGVSIQPSEISKVFLIIGFAGYFANHVNELKQIKYGIIYPILLVLPPALILYVFQDHLSALLIICFVVFVMAFVAGSNGKILACATVGGIAGIIGVLNYAATHAVGESGFRWKRMASFMNPELDPTGTGYQIKQSLYALGSGGMFGVGLGESKQKYMYIPEPQNDFIFAIIAEELGFVGCVTLIVIYGLFIWRGILASMRCETVFGELLGIGITSMVGIQAILNMMVVTSSMPVTGITLPFISYGGTALLILLSCMGILLNISKDGKKLKDQNPNEYQKGRELE